MVAAHPHIETNAFHAGTLSVNTVPALQIFAKWEFNTLLILFRFYGLLEKLNIAFR